MYIVRNKLSAAALVAFATYSVAQSAPAQEAHTGVSQPDETPITASPIAATPTVAPDATAQAAPIVYGPYKPYKPLYGSEPVDSYGTSASQPVLRAASESTMPPPAAARPAVVDIDAGIVTRVAGPSNALPVGTILKIKMRESLSTISTVPGSRFDGELIEPILRDGVVLLPAGSILSGRVSEVHGGRRISGAASIRLTPQLVTLPDGVHYPVNAQVIDTNLYRSTKVDTEGTIIRRDHPKEMIATLGLTAGGGAAAGAVFGGGVGAVVGAGVGAGITTALWLKQDRQTTLPTDTLITFTLNTPINVGTR